MKKIVLILFIFLIVGFVSAQVVTSDENFLGNSRTGTASFVNYGSSFSSYYGSQASTYWPILGERDQCFASQDIMVQISPGGCQPAVVRSDLLAEQNVPVFCQLDLLQINPVVNIKQIRNIRFTGSYPEYVAGVGFHPANAALRTSNQLLGTPLQSNIGYVVVVLKRNPDENNIPEFFNFTLSASIDYYSGNAVGIGTTELLLKETSDEEWQVAKNKQILFGGKMSVRVTETENNDSINVELYSGDIKYSELTLIKNQQQPSPVYLPGSYCQTALQFSYTDFVSPSLIARVQVDDDILDLYESSRFLNNKCAVRRVSGDSTNGAIDITCGNQRLNLTTSVKALAINDKVWKIGKNYSVDTSSEYTITNVTKNSSGVFYKINTEEILPSGFLRAVSSSVLQDASYGSYDSYLINATRDYELIADSYGNELNEIGIPYGETALGNAIRLALKYDKKTEAARLINKYLSSYPQGADAIEFTRSLNELYLRDSSLAGTAVQTDDGYHTIRLIEVTGSGKKSSAFFAWNSEPKKIEQGNRSVDFSGLGKITLLSVKNAETVEIEATCNSDSVNKVGYKGPIRPTDDRITACGSVIRVSQIDFQNYVKLRIAPVSRSGTITNFTVGIGIEKRVIELTPDKARRKIENLNESIRRWESISNRLNSVVTNLKAACFATAGVLTVKNFFTGLSGEALARRSVMSGQNGWTDRCQAAVSAGNYSSLTACYNANSAKISNDVTSRENAIEQTNTVTSAIEKANPEGEGSFNDVKARQQLIERIRDECSAVNLGTRSSGVGYQNITSLLPVNENANVDSYSYSQLRDIYFNCKVAQDTSGSAEGRLRASTELDALGLNLGENLNYQKTLNNYNGAQVHPISDKPAGNYYRETVDTLESKGFVIPNIDGETPVQIIKGNDGKNYLITLDKQGNEYIAKTGGVYSLEGTSQNRLGSPITNLNSNSALTGLPQRYTEVTAARYNHQFAPGDKVVRYFETEPYKGRAAIVPFDFNRGFYAATSQALPFGGGTKSFEENGRPSSFYVCNIMGNKRIDFNSPGYGDDECTQFNYYTGQSYSNFPGLNEADSRKLVADAIKALNEATQQYGQKTVRIGTSTLNVGSAAALLPGSQCQDYMSPEDCKILFNVCDPVICPSSRCNFGGQYYVSDVIQSGIVGSALLCLPNIKEDIVIPVCLTGIKAGIDGYLSILKSHQACLQEAVETGKYVGICDQVSSVYLCEFFWRQAAPLAKTLVPKLIEQVAYGGQGQVRGGGEYLTVSSSWQNAQESVNYFTQSYAVNSFEAFRIRSLEEAGTEICRAFVSAKIPNNFETLIEADSPPQFHAWYSSIDYTDATVPATSQYKVFYHIFAGNERGVSYSVYLKDPPSGGQFASTPIVTVATGFVARGQYATESKDFTAPKGYQQLCVRINDKEECGFRQVSSSFAIDYVRDSIVSDELTRTDITTEGECISGATSPAALLNPNLQSIGEEAFNPAIYNRGIVRICATDNPGSATDPARFVKVGVCGTERLQCWLDKKSLDNAISDSNVGIRNETLSEITQIQKANLQSDKRYSGDISKEISELQSQVDNADSSGFSNLLVRVDALMEKAFWNNDKANVLLLRARLFGNVFEKSIGKIEVTGTVSVPSETPTVQESQQRIIGFDGDYSEGTRTYITLNEQRTDIYLLNSRIFIGSERVGIIDNNERLIFQNDEQKDFVDGALFSGAFDLFNGEEITVEEIQRGFNSN